MKHSKQLNRKAILAVVLISIPIICLGFVSWVLIEFRAAAREAQDNWVKTDISQYSDIRGQWNYEPLFSHFPPQLPKNATGANMLYSPPFLQKGLLFHLWLKLPEDEINKQYATYSELAASSDGEQTLLFQSHPALSMHHTSYGTEGEVLPKGYEIIVLGAASKDKGNHGHTYGVAINKSTSEILYWAEAW